MFCTATYATHVKNDVSKHILFYWFDNNLAVCCIAIYATHVNNDVSKHILFDWFDNNLAVCCAIQHTVLKRHCSHV